MDGSLGAGALALFYYVHIVPIWVEKNILHPILISMERTSISKALSIIYQVSINQQSNKSFRLLPLHPGPLLPPPRNPNLLRRAITPTNTNDDRPPFHPGVILGP